MRTIDERLEESERDDTIDDTKKLLLLQEDSYCRLGDGSDI